VRLVNRAGCERRIAQGHHGRGLMRPRDVVIKLDTGVQTCPRGFILRQVLGHSIWRLVRRTLDLEALRQIGPRARRSRTAAASRAAATAKPSHRLALVKNTRGVRCVIGSIGSDPGAITASLLAL